MPFALCLFDISEGSCSDQCSSVRDRDNIAETFVYNAEIQLFKNVITLIDFFSVEFSGDFTKFRRLISLCKVWLPWTDLVDWFLNSQNGFEDKLIEGNEREKNCLYLFVKFWSCSWRPFGKLNERRENKSDRARISVKLKRLGCSQQTQLTWSSQCRATVEVIFTRRTFRYSRGIS